ncbi:MAG TPA: TlpA disulfide reductase family protein [Noviherbaspirillum sp.]|nr:TlpA disulfide reductase family protein [Noviherbaspirillum sp.]
MKKNLAIFSAVAVLFAAIGVFFGMQRLEPQAPQASATGVLFSQTFADSKGNEQEFDQWKGKFLIVNFWATWCAPCVEEMPELVALQAEIASRNMQILGIGIDSAANIKEFAAKHQISYPLYIGGMGGTELARQLGNQAGALPFTVLIGADGAVKKTYLGRLKMEELRRDLQSM